VIRDYGVVLGSLASSPDEAPTPAPDTAEAELVRRAQLGSAAAFERLVVLRGPNLHRYLVVRLGSESDALDALQEALTAAWQGLPGLKERELFWPWLVGIAAHKAADVARRRQPSGPVDFDVAHEDASFLEFREAVAGLAPQFREVLLLRYFLELSEDEVARALGIRVGTVKSRTNRARKALQELIG
jgi:RNA polymerase sigma factor (sigma-70 family)